VSVSLTRQIGRLVGGRYRLVSLIGAGGMGAVYRAVHTNMGKDFAVKVLRPELSRTEEAARRFEREAEAASRLAHPGCVRVTDFGRDDGALFLVMEHLDGRSLAAVLGETPRLHPARAVHIAAQILDAVGHAHAQGVVHRDLKPENVMLARVDDDPDHVTICDFGLARVAAPGDGSGITDAGALFGTPEYLSPEQALGEPADGRADLYAIGVMLFEMLAGRRPFVGATRSELLAAHLTREPPSLREVTGDGSIPAELDQVTAIALRKRKSERWAMAQDFRAALIGAPVPAAEAPVSLEVRSTPPVVVPEVRTQPLERDRDPTPRDVAPAAAPDPAAPPDPRRRRMVLVAGAAGALVTLIVVIVAAVSAPSTSPSPSGSTSRSTKGAPTVELEAIRVALRKGDVKGSRAAAERLARAYPDDVRAYVLLGDVLFAQRQTERGLAAYREAARMDRVLASGHDELRANLLATFDDRVHGSAAQALAEELGIRR
jgi:serine/threonine-protein kinase